MGSKRKNIILNQGNKMPQIRPSRFAVWLEGDLKNLRASRRQCAQGQTWEMRGQSQAQERK